MKIRRYTFFKETITIEEKILEKLDSYVELLEVTDLNVDIYGIDNNRLKKLADDLVELFVKWSPDSEEIRMKAGELDEKDFRQWWWETFYEGNFL